ncbi:tonB-system energizer ExbB [Rhodopseudomonas palustris]|uniref:tonB-system energizer ExbB n=1 Tax=Rhodopseudomonas palustris TaxID=1076 RepID=UPI0021F2C705|nr:tonB-system energizer ExbB [Rhodopseudomonas palustris]UYO55968.1 tonB-system energizer ExbB [Rhodopseudomonas palustris]
MRKPQGVAAGHAGAAIAALAVIAAALPGDAWAAADLATLPRDLSPWGMFLGADAVVKTVMVGLALASLAAWTVWLAKSIELRRSVVVAQRGLDRLESEITLQQAAVETADQHDAVAQMIQTVDREASLSGGAHDEGFRERVALRLERVEAAEARRAAIGTGLLASIGAVAPFVGLFGTVWGIMNAFIGISKANTTNLAVVAPGIAEALLATALGLVAAIPAVVIYNHLTRRVTAYRALLGDASTQLLLMISREAARPPQRARVVR